MKRNLQRFLMAALAAMLGTSAWAQTNIIANWQGGDDASSKKPTEFGWASTNTNRSWGTLNGSGARLIDNYSGYKDESGNTYSYNSNDKGTRILYIRYGTTSEKYTYTFTGLTAGNRYKFSGLVGWHNNSNAPTFTITIGTADTQYASLAKYISAKTTLYSVSKVFDVPSSETNESFQLAFTSNQTGDNMESLSQLSIVEIANTDALLGEIKKATALNTILKNADLTTEISNATNLANNESATQTDVENEVDALKAYYKDIKTVSLSNASFDTETDWATANVSTNTSREVTNWTASGTYEYASGSAFQLGSSCTNNGVTPPAKDMYGNATGGVLGVSSGWNTAMTYSQVISSLTAGNYILYYEAYNNGTAESVNTNQCGLNGTNDQTANYAKAVWTANAVSIYVSDDVTNVNLTLGFASGNATSTSYAKMFYDNVIVYYLGWDSSTALADLATYVTTANSIKDSKMSSSASEALTAAISTAQGYIDAKTCTKAEATTAKTNLTNAIETANKSITDYAALKTALDNANAYTSLSGSKVALENAIKIAQNIYDEATTADCTEAANTLETARQTANVADYNYVHGESSVYTQTYTTNFGANNVAFQNGSGEGYKSGDTYRDKNTDNCEVGAYYTISLHKGSYVLEGYGRGQVGNNLRLQVKVGDNTMTSSFLMKANTGLGVNTSGAADFTTGDDHEYNNNGAGYGWEYRAIEFTLDEDADVTLGVYGHNYANHWISAYLPVLKTTDVVMSKIALKDALDEAPSVPTEHVSESVVFDYNKAQVEALSSALSKANGVYENATATKAEVDAQTAAVKALVAPALNAPSATQAYKIILKYNGWTYDNCAMTAEAGARSDMGNYNVQYVAQNDNYAQAMYFTQVEGGYNISWTDADGATRYLCTGTVWGGNDGQIRTSANKDDALVVTISRNGDYINLYDVAAGKHIGSQDAGVFPVESHIDFVAEETTATHTITVSMAAGYATVCLPYAAEISGVKAYSVTGVQENGTSLTLQEATSLEANKAYVLEGTTDYSFSGVNIAYAAPSANGLLTGVYAETTAPVGSYVLQKNDGKVAFYVVGSEESDAKPTVKVNRAYLTTSSSTTAKALNFTGEDATAINAINALTSGNAKIYDVNGRQLKQLKKGINIVNGAKVLVK